MSDNTRDQQLIIFQDEHREAENQEEKKEEDDAQNIKKVTKDADLSPRHRKDLQNMTKKVKQTRNKGSHVTTRSNSSRSSQSK